LFVFYFFLGISGSIYEYSMRKDFQEYDLSLSHITYLITFPLFPWGFKCLLAAMSESFPVFGLYRKPYMIIGNFFAAISCCLLMLQKLYIGQFVLIMCFVQFFACLADVNYDGILIEEGNIETIKEEGRLQNRIFVVRTVGRMIGRTTQSILWEQITSKGVYGVLSVCYIIPLIISLFIPEKKKKIEPINKEVISIELDSTGNVVETIIPATPATSFCWGLSMIKKSLLHPYLRVPLVFTLISGILPSAGTPNWYFINDVVHLTPTEVSILSFFAELGQLFMLLVFECGLRKFKIRNIFVIICFLKIVSGLLPLGLVTKSQSPDLVCLRDGINNTVYNDTCYFYEHEKISPFVFSMGDNVIGGLLEELQFLPVAIITKTLCSGAMGMTTYTLVLSLANLDSGIRNLIDSGMILFFNIDHYKFEALPVYNQFCTFLDIFCAVFILFFITPKTLGEIREEVEQEKNGTEFTRIRPITTDSEQAVV
jgi:BT1 family